jgi:hypothetical protein
MTAQPFIVILIVLACSVYAGWVLMPAAARRFLATRLLRLPVPNAWLALLQRTANQSSGCDCSGCDKAEGLQPKPETQVIRFHPQRKG